MPELTSGFEGLDSWELPEEYVKAGAGGGHEYEMMEDNFKRETWQRLIEAGFIRIGTNRLAVRS